MIFVRILHTHGKGERGKEGLANLPGFSSALAEICHSQSFEFRFILDHSRVRGDAYMGKGRQTMLDLTSHLLTSSRTLWLKAILH